MGFFQLVDYIWVFFLVCGIPILIIWLVVMNKAIDQVSHDLRRIEPGAVWLCLIPAFNLVWQFIVTNAVSEGIAKELLARNMYPNEEKPAYAYGLSGCILVSCCIIPYVGVLVAILGLVLLVIHAVKISEYNSIISKSGRWETRYNARMEAIRSQMNQSWQQNHPYPNYQAPQQFTQPTPFYNVPPPPVPQQPIIPPPGYYNPDEVNKFSKKKDKPENPFG